MNFGFLPNETDSEPIVVECFIPATPEEVFLAWTEPDIVTRWFGHTPNSLHSATIDLRPGGAWQFLTSKDDRKSIGFEGKYLDVRYGERLVFTWSRVIAHADGEREVSLHAEIEVTFKMRGSGTDIRLVHTVKRLQDLRRGIDDGWQKAFNGLEVLFRRTETRV